MNVSVICGLRGTHRTSLHLLDFGNPLFNQLQHTRRLLAALRCTMGIRMSQVTLNINGQTHTVDVPSDMPLLWALRDTLNLTGTKYSCGTGVCGTCTVLINGTPMRSCVMPAISMAGAEITTIEGLDPSGNHPVQRAWNDEDVPQCGYCQGGQILTASVLLKQNPNPSDQDIDAAMAGVLCRCGTYSRIRKAIKRAAEYAAREGATS